MYVPFLPSFIFCKACSISLVFAIFARNISPMKPIILISTFVLSVSLLTGCGGSAGKRAEARAVRQAIERQLEEYPESRVQDIYKCFCQDKLGPEHLIPNAEAAKAYLSWELATYRQDLDSGKYEKPALRHFPVGDQGNYVRVDLSVVLDGLISEDDYLDAFVRSANAGFHESPEQWRRQWTAIAACIRHDFAGIPDAAQDLAVIDTIMAGDHLILHHSEAFSEAYHPHYRIIARDIFEKEMYNRIHE